jgi:putative endonuclease
MSQARELGLSGEEAAERFLRKERFDIIRRGFRFQRGEIDLIAYDRETLVFVEVKTRRDLGCGLPEESVTPAKQRQIRKIAEAFLAVSHLENVPCRFDILSLLRQGDGSFAIHHIRDAF